MSLTFCAEDFEIFLKALRFAAEKHRLQQRKGADHPPYINHPIEVTEILWQVGGVRDVSTLAAALLHDTLEDTDTTPEEIRREFGEDILSLVMEVTDDKTLPKAERKRLQIVNAPHKTPRARQIKLGDKISNVREMTTNSPSDWSFERRKEYLEWTVQVIDGLRGDNPALENRYDAVLAEAKKHLGEEMRQHSHDDQNTVQ